MKYSENKFQNEIISSVKYEGGWAQRISSQFNAQAGVPDLLISMPYLIPFVAEAKWLGTVKPFGTYKLEVTPLQREFLRRFDATRHSTLAEGQRCCLLVAYERADEVRGIYSCVLPWDTERISIDQTHATSATSKRMGAPGHYNVSTMFRSVRIGAV